MITSDQLRYSDGFVLRPDKYYTPSYRISPFRTEDIGRNLLLPKSVKVIDELNIRFCDRGWRFTKSGKEAISIALNALKLESTDCVTILTTSGNTYISKCVTQEIEKFCKWSRRFEDNTTAIFVNHEFGHPYRNLSTIKRHGLPIIEDACHSYLADTPEGNIGTVGEFTVFSLPKVFPVQMGGLLSYDCRYFSKGSEKALTSEETYLATVMSHYFPELEYARKRRISNYQMLTKSFASIGCIPRFELLESDVPGAFVFTAPESVNLTEMKEYGWAHGIECSVFYGEHAFFIPVHQRLSEEDLNYFFTVFSSFIQRY